MLNLILSLLIIGKSLAETAPIPGCEEQSLYTIEGKKVSVCWINDIEAWVSSDCVSKKKTKCGSIVIHDLALQNLFKLEPSDTRGGKNPGCAICKTLGGKVNYGSEDGESQQTFCLAHDGSYIDTNALTKAFYESIDKKGDQK